MTQKDMINACKSKTEVLTVLDSCCSFRLRGGCGKEVKNRCWQRCQRGACSGCGLQRAANERCKELAKTKAPQTTTTLAKAGDATITINMNNCDVVVYYG